MATDVGKLNLLLAADASEFLSATKQASDAAKRMQTSTSSSFAGVASAAKSMAVVAGGAFAALGVAAFAKSAVMGASDVSESMSKVNTVFGESAAAIDAFSKTAATKIGLSRGAALDAAGSFGNMFQQLKIGAPVAASMSTTMLELAADFASFHNADISEVINAQSSAFRGEYDSLQRFLPLINAANVEQKAMEMTGKANAKALTEQEKALAVYQLMVEGAGAAQGDFKRTSEGMANSMRIISASFQNASVTIGEKLLPVIAPLVQRFAQELPGAIDKTLAMFDIIGDTIKALTSGEGFDKLYTKIGEAFGQDVLDAVGAFIDVLAKLRTETLPQVVEAVQKVVDTGKEIQAYFNENKLAADALGSALVGLTTVAIARFVASLPAMIAQVGAVTAGLLAQGAAATAAAAATAVAMAPFAAAAIVFGTVAMAAKQVYDNWVLVEMGAGILKKSLEILHDWIRDNFPMVYNFLVRPFVDAWNVISGIVSNIGNAIAGIIGGGNTLNVPAVGSGSPGSPERAGGGGILLQSMRDAGGAAGVAVGAGMNSATAAVARLRGPGGMSSAARASTLAARQAAAAAQLQRARQIDSVFGAFGFQHGSLTSRRLRSSTPELDALNLKNDDRMTQAEGHPMGALIMQLIQLLNGGLTVEMDGNTVGRVVSRGIDQRADLRSRMAGAGGLR